MPKLTVTFDLPDLHDRFVCGADDDKIKSFLVQMNELAQRNALSPEALLDRALDQARMVLSNPDPV